MRNYILNIAVLLTGISLGLIISQNFFLPPPTSIQVEKEIVEKVVVQECPKDPATEILPAPALSPTIHLPLVTNHEGEVRVAWEAVPHARKYKIRIFDKKGQVVKTNSTDHTSLYLKEIPFDKNLPFTRYTLHLSTFNKDDIEGEPSPPYELNVYPLKNLIAPSINEIIIED